MPAFNRVITQRNNNTTSIIPNFLEFSSSNPIVDISGSTIYNLTINNAQFSNGIYTVDMSGLDSSGNLLNVDGTFSTGSGEGIDSINIIMFALTINTSASNYPGLEFTIFFKNIPTNRLTSGPPLLTIGLITDYSEIPLPAILSPPFPQITGANINPSITLKSDGTSFNVVSSGPAGWMGFPALTVILAAYSSPGEGCSIM